MPTEETVMDAVNAALGQETAPSEPTDEIETPEAEAPEAEAPEAEAPEAEAPETEGEETEAEAEARGAERDPTTGKFVKKGDEPKVEAEKPKAAEPAKKDPINDPIPAGLKKDTTERIRTLIDTTKTVTAERDDIQKNFDFMVNGVQATGATPEQYGETLSWLAMFNSGDPRQQEKALELVETVAERLATLLGKERTVGDPLSAHADLKDAVAKGQVTAQYAREIARTRNGQQFRSQIGENLRQQETQQAQAQQEQDRARSDLTTLEQTLMSTDPQYAAKKAALVPILQPIFKTIPASQWKDKFIEAYRAFRMAPTSAPAKPPVNQPLRAGKQPAGGQTKAPGSAREAMDAALSGMTGK